MCRRCNCWRTGGDAGFTLVELMVALAIFSMTAIALLKVQGENARVALAVEEKMIAAIIAENHLVELMTKPTLPDLGSRQGDADMAGRTWQWTEIVTQTPGADLLRIDVETRRADGRQVVAARTAFRGRQ